MVSKNQLQTIFKIFVRSSFGGWMYGAQNDFVNFSVGMHESLPVALLCTPKLPTVFNPMPLVQSNFRPNFRILLSALNMNMQIFCEQNFLKGFSHE